MLLQHSPQSDPMGEAFNYAEEFKKLDLKAVVKDFVAAWNRVMNLDRFDLR